MNRRLETVYSQYTTCRNYFRTGSVVEGFNAATDWELLSENGTVSDNAVNFKSGGSALKFTVTTAGSSARAQKIVSINFGVGGLLGLWIYLHDAPADYAYMQIYMSSTTNWSKFYYRTVSLTTLQQGWNFVYIEKNFANDGTGESFANTMLRLRFLVFAATGKTPSVTLDEFRSGVSFIPKIIFTFDDGLKGVYDSAFPYMASKGMRGTCYINSSKVGATYEMTLASLQALKAAGWDVANHGATHANYTNLSVAEIQTDIQDGIDWLTTNGFGEGALHFGVPGGIHNANCITAIGNTLTRSVRNSADSKLYPSQINLLAIPTTLVVRDTTPVATITAAIADTMLTGKACILMFHNVAETPAWEYDYSTANFQAVIDYIDINGYGSAVVPISLFREKINR